MILRQTLFSLRKLLTAILCASLLTLVSTSTSVADELVASAVDGVTTSSGIGVSIYADLGSFNDERPGLIDFDAEDNLFVGNLNTPDQPAQDDFARIWRVGRLYQDVAYFGGLIPDPDVVLVDHRGDLADPGSIIVGHADSACTNDCTGTLTAISPDGNATYDVVSSDTLGNVQTLAFDSTGRLYALNFNRREVVYIENGSVFVFISQASEGLAGPVVDDTDHVYVSFDGIVREYSPDGTVVDASVTRGLPRAFTSFSLFPGLIVQRVDSLFSVNTDTKAESLLVVGTGGPVAFDSYGYMYVSDANRLQILVVYPVGSGINDTGIPPTPPSLVLHPNVPNPFNPSTTIPFFLHRSGDITLRIYDASGREVKTLLQGFRSAGPHNAVWNGTTTSGQQATSGVYFARLRLGNSAVTKKLVLLK